MSGLHTDFPSKEKRDDEGLIAIAAYVEQMIASEQAWIMNRLHWLFTSQSFLIAAFVAIIVTTVPVSEKPLIRMVSVALPFVGLIFCILVAGAIYAAESVLKELSDERARLSERLNSEFTTQIPLIGACAELRKHLYWTFVVGSLPHQILPWVLALFWIVALAFILFCH